MKQLKHILIFTIFLGSFTGIAQIDKDSELFRTLKTNDSLLFEVGFNTCDLSQFENLMAEDLEFYHDKSGVTTSSSQFLEVMKTGLCKPSNTHKTRRELIKGSLEVFPLYDNGVLYGAIQVGEHRFFEKNNDQPEKVGSNAKFIHLWTNEDGQWRLKRVLSFDHQLNIVDKKTKITLSQALLDDYTGTYNAKNTGTVIISSSNGGLEMNAGRMQSPINPESETVFLHPERPLSFEFIRDSEGHTIKIIVRENDKIVDEAIKQLN
jgi:hypothetical protein